MNTFTISQNTFLSRNIQGFYYTDFYGSGHPNNPNFLYKCKNDIHHNWSVAQLNVAVMELRNILKNDLPGILNASNLNSLTVCVVPRSKASNFYNENQQLFKSTVQQVVKEMTGFVDGTNFITRHTNTRTTHLRKPIIGFQNDGNLPYPGITTDTCEIVADVKDKNILLIDDIYTKTVNIDEDALEALLKKGAKSVLFYAIGKTISHF
jgi:hypothetical protein